MNRLKSFLIPFLLIMVTTFSGCEVIGDIFKAGVWVGIILVVAVLVLIFWLINKAKK